MLLKRYALYDGVKLGIDSFAVQFKLPKFVIHRVVCDVLEGQGRVVEAITCFRQMESELAGDMNFRDEQAQWILSEW